MNRSAVCMILAVAAGCSSIRQSDAPRPRHSEFIPSEYAKYEVKGTGTVVGSAFLRTAGGDVKLGAGQTVTMNPMTSYSSEWFRRAAVEGVQLEPGDPRAAPFTRTAIAGADGGFRFEGVPEGTYYVVCRIVWAVGYQYSGGVARAIVQVRDGRTTNVVCTISPTCDSEPFFPSDP